MMPSMPSCISPSASASASSSSSATGRARAAACLARLVLAGALLASSGAAGEPLPVEEVAPGVFVHSGADALMTAENRGDIANLGFVVGEEAVAVIDTGGSVAVGADLLEAVRTVTDRPVRYVINTHMHPDHVFGNAAFRGSGPGGTDPAFVADAKLARALASRAAFYRDTYRGAMGAALIDPVETVLPDIAVTGAATLDLGGRSLTLTAWPTAHTDNDLTVLDETTATLFAGDLVFLGHLPVIDGSLTGWLDADPQLAAIPAARVVPGHGPATAPWPDALAPQRAYFEALAAALRRLIADGAGMAEAVAAAPPPQGWALVEEFHRRNATAAFAELEWE